MTDAEDLGWNQAGFDEASKGLELLEKKAAKVDELEARVRELERTDAALRLIASAACQHLVDSGPCDYADDDNGDSECQDLECSYCALNRECSKPENYGFGTPHTYKGNPG